MIVVYKRLLEWNKCNIQGTRNQNEGRNALYEGLLERGSTAPQGCTQPMGHILPAPELEDPAQHNGKRMALASKGSVSPLFKRDPSNMKR